MPTKAPVPMPACHCFALRQAARFVSVLYDRHLSKAGLTTSQFSIMSAIRANPGIAVHDLAERLVMERTSLVRAIQPLTRDGWVQQLPAPDHPRKLVLSLTAAGERHYAQAYEHWLAAQQEFEAQVGAERAAALRGDLLDVTARPAP